MLWLLFFAIFIGYLACLWIALAVSGDIIGAVSGTAVIILVFSGLYTFIVFIVSANAYSEDERALATHLAPALSTFVVSLAVFLIGNRISNRKANPHLDNSWNMRRIVATPVEGDEISHLNALLEAGLISPAEYAERLEDLPQS